MLVVTKNCGFRLQNRIKRESEERILSEIENVNIKVLKTQISFSNRQNFAFVSFLPARKAKERPKVYITVTFGLHYKKESSRIDVAIEPYPNRWTHHVRCAWIPHQFFHMVLCDLSV